jgi:hypothetical protein
MFTKNKIINNESKIKDLDFFMYPMVDSTCVDTTDDYLFLKNPNSKFSNLFLEYPIEEINDFNFRSDNFKKNHIGVHTLFSGCSNTFGIGLNKNEMWSHKLLSKINNNSGYFNLSVIGSSIINQIADIFKYFNTYGNPNVIFFNMPNLNRFYYYKNNFQKNGHFNKESKPVLKILVYQYYLMLEQYCNLNNIQLYCFSWNEETQNFMSKHFQKTFYVINNDELLSFVYDYKETTKDEFAFLARDNFHFGTGYNLYWANFIYDKYLQNNKK